MLHQIFAELVQNKTLFVTRHFLFVMHKVAWNPYCDIFRQEIELPILTVLIWYSGMHNICIPS